MVEWFDVVSTTNEPYNQGHYGPQAKINYGPINK